MKLVKSNFHFLAPEGANLPLNARSFLKKILDNQLLIYLSMMLTTLTSVDNFCKHAVPR